MLADNYQAISPELRKPSEKISAFMRSIFRPGKSARADAAAAADPVAAISDADELGAQETIKPILNIGVAKDRPESPDSISPAQKAGQAQLTATSFALDQALIDPSNAANRIDVEQAKYTEGAEAARRLLHGKAIASPAEMKKYEDAATEARRLLGRKGSEAEIKKYNEGAETTRRLLGKVVGSEADLNKYATGAAAARAVLGKPIRSTANSPQA